MARRRQLIVAHDLGTSGDKASLHDASGRLLAATTVAYATDFGPGGRAEQDPEDWWRAFCEATRTLLATSGARPADVACVVLSGQMMGLVLVDAADAVLRPAIIGADTRAQAERDELAARVGLERGYAITGHRLDATYSLAKAMWVRAHEPDTWSRAEGILLAKDYVTLRLTGRRCTDPSDASGTNAWDQAAGTWSAELLGAAELDAGLLPEVLPSTTVAGGLLAGASRACGLLEGTPVVVGGGDGACAALGAGLVTRASGANVAIGSSAWISVASDAPLRDPRMRTFTFDHVIPGRYVPTGTMQAGGASLDWLVTTLGATSGADRVALFAAAAEVEAAGEGLFFLPYLLGERSPIWDARARGTFVGLARHHGPAHVARAVLEGVAFNLRTILLALREVAGAIPSVDAVGGGARSDVWLRIVADAWGATVRRRSIVDEANSLGAAVVGGMAVGLIDGWVRASELSTVEAVIEPDPVRHERYVAWHARFADAWERLAPWFAGG
ncbi:xylulokinase [soil metagenome]